MKKLILTALFLFTSSVFARSADYSCRVRQYNIDLNLTQDTSTSLFFRDGYDVLGVGYAGWVEKAGAKTNYHFYLNQYSPMILTFKTQDTEDLPQKLVGWIDVHAPFFVLWDELVCRRID